MIRVVYDCNVVMSGIGWNGAARQCLKLVASRQVFLYVTDEILAEYETVIPEIIAEEMPKIDPQPKLAWLRNKSRRVEPAPLGKRRSRDVKDDIYLAAAMAASATCLVTYDKDLLTLGKPFGIETIRPPEFLRRMKAGKL
jgi:putative PIN family toxin of toxin-antitoxin system